MKSMGGYWNWFLFASLLVYIQCVSRVDCGDKDFRIVITTDLEDGLYVECLSEDQTLEKKPRKIMPKDLTYSYDFDGTSVLLNSFFYCKVSNHEGNTMMFTAWDKKYAEKSWKFPIHNSMREVRWSVNHVGAWLWMKGRPRPDSIMKWQVDMFWPSPCPSVVQSNESGPSNWETLEEAERLARETVKLKPRILPPIYIPEFLMKPFVDRLHVLPWFQKGPWKR